MIKPKALVIGGSSPAAAFFVNSLKNEYDLEVFSSVDILFIKSFRYSEFNLVKNKRYEKVFIFSSGVPSKCTTFEEYEYINGSIKDILSIINLECSSLTFLSSYSVFDKNLGIIDENTEFSPSDYYGESKVQMELYLKDMYADVVSKLNILRLPVYIYKGVCNNFLGAQLKRAHSSELVRLSNPNSKFYAVIDDKSLYAVDEHTPAGINSINCSSNGDLCFSDLKEVFINEGATDVEWVKSNRPSAIIVQPKKYRHLFEKISTKKIIEEWVRVEN